MRLRTAAACANGARSTAVARRDGRSHKRSGGTSTKLLASVPFDPSVGAIGVDLAASLGQHAPRRCGPTTFLHLVGDSHDRCARTERHELAVWQGYEGRTATARIGCHHQYHAVAASECSWRRERTSCRWQLRFGARSRDGARCTPWVVGGLGAPVAPPRRPSAAPGEKSEAYDRAKLLENARTAFFDKDQLYQGRSAQRRHSSTLLGLYHNTAWYGAVGH